MVEHKSRRRRRITRWALAASLGINLLFVGAFAGAAYRSVGGPGAPGGQGPGIRSNAAPYIQALPRENRRAMFRALRAGEHGAAPMSKKARHAQYQQMLSVLRATPFDPAAAKAVLSVQREALLGQQKAAQAAWVEQVANMTEDERADYANTMENILKRGPKRPARSKKREN